MLGKNRELWGTGISVMWIERKIILEIKCMLDNILFVEYETTECNVKNRNDYFLYITKLNA